MDIIEMSVDALIPYENNPRINDKAVDKVALSISAFGFKVPIIIDADDVIVAGHTRLKAAKKLGLKTVPCIRADDLTDEQIKAFRLADNKVSEFAEWDEEKLLAELEELENIDMSLYGFDELSRTLEEATAGSGGNDGFTYKEQYGVIVVCDTEESQRAVYEHLTEQGYECKVVTV